MPAVKLRILAGVLAAVLALAAPAQAQTGFSATSWLADLDQLRDAMTAGYANLEWQAARGLDLPATYTRARSRVAAARDDYEARRAFERFLTAFGDGHLEIHWPAPAHIAPQPASTSPESPQPLCARLGFFDGRDDGGPAVRLPGARPAGEPAARFPAAIVNAGGRRLAVLRIGSFLPKAYPDICDKVAPTLGLTAASPCDAACQDAVDKAASAVFVGDMARQVQALAAARPDVLMVDVSGNGGGDDSSVALARMITARPLARARGGGLMGEAWARELAEREADAAKALKAAPPAGRAALKRFDAALIAAHADALRSCDRSPLWSGRPIACTAQVPEPLYDGFWSSVPAQDSQVMKARTIWTGPILVVVDGDSASSTEWLAAMLQDSHAGVVVGSPTFGAGCGHMTDAAPVKLTHSGASVSMPDCWRLRANGQNEAGGVEPDVLIGFREHDTLAERTARLTHALPRVLTHVGRP